MAGITAAACAASESLGFFVFENSCCFGSVCLNKKDMEWLLYNVQLRIFTNSAIAEMDANEVLMQWVHLHSFQRCTCLCEMWVCDKC